MERLLIMSAKWKRKFYEKLIQYIPETKYFIKIVSAHACESNLAPPIPLPSSRMFAQIKKFEPDVILTDYVGYPPWFAKFYEFISKRKIPLIYRLRGDFWTELKDSYHYYKAYQKMEFLLWTRPLRRSSIKHPNLILPICRWLEKIANKKVPKIKTYVIYQGVEPKDWYFDPGFESIESPSVAIYQNHTVPLKVHGLLWFSNVMKKLQDVNFYIGGGGKYKKLVIDRCRNLKNVFILPWLPPNEARKFLSSADVYVLPSGLDCCPTTLLEAALTMRPCVASKVGGIPELIVEGETGWTVENGLTRTWEDCIRTLLEDHRRARYMGKSARTHVINKFSWQVISKEYITAIKQAYSVNH